ncbi:MAG: hypothetical protein IJ740_05130 [Ruminococcus sp.]|nr:hypothetical protein [Ruminococcus sp.]
MAQDKLYYVGVINDDNTISLVTDIKGKSAEWDKDKAPMDFSSKTKAADISNGLLANGFPALVIETRFRLLGQFNTPNKEDDDNQGGGEGAPAAVRVLVPDYDDDYDDDMFIQSPGRSR